MVAITISRQMGSLGRQIGERLAETLGFRLVWREVINQAASRARAPEVALATIDELDLLGLRPKYKDVKAYHDAVREIMGELVEEGNVIIVGRAGQAILRGASGVLHVRIYAPLQVRVERLMSQQKVSAEVATAQLTASDEHRKRYLRRYYQIQWDDPILYDLMINTAVFDVAAATAIIREAVRNNL